VHRAIQRFEVSLKAFIVRDGHALFVREADTGFWELPGGRIDVGEEWQDHTAVLRREISEELGDGVLIEPGTVSITFVRQRPTDLVFQFLVARPCRLLSGTPVLSDEHASLQWVTREQSRSLTFPPDSAYPDAIARLWRVSGAEV
jgi:8-oxo-dGTP pyrophosphatase MutT (NUDIX family)